MVMVKYEIELKQFSNLESSEKLKNNYEYNSNDSNDSNEGYNPIEAFRRLKLLWKKIWSI